MKGEKLRLAIRDLIETHPNIKRSEAGHSTHAWRYMVKAGKPIAMEPQLIEFQKIWVRADSINRTTLRDLEHSYRAYKPTNRFKPNHNLYGEASFKNCDLIAYRITNLWQAVHVIRELAGDGAKP